MRASRTRWRRPLLFPRTARWHVARSARSPARPGPSEFNTPHSIAISADRRVFVVDRGHERMQVFDENGKFLDMWPLRSPTWPASIRTLVVNHIITQDGYIWAGDTGTNRILKFDLKGNFLYSWSAPGPQPGRLNSPHGCRPTRSATSMSLIVSVDKCRNLRRNPMRTRRSLSARSCDTSFRRDERLRMQA